MARKHTIKYSKVSNGQYTVTIDLQKFQDKIALYDFEPKLREYLAACGREIKGICEFYGNKLIYKSETLFPAKKYIRKQKVLIIFGTYIERIRKLLYNRFPCNLIIRI